MSTLVVMWLLGAIPLLAVLAVPAWLALAGLIAKGLRAWRRRA
jgi:cytochrome c oxidase assembly factor CtaG